MVVLFLSIFLIPDVVPFIIGEVGVVSGVCYVVEVCYGVDGACGVCHVGGVGDVGKICNVVDHCGPRSVGVVNDVDGGVVVVVPLLLLFSILLSLWQ